MSKTTNKKPISKTRKIINWILTGIFGVLFVIVAVFQIAGLATKNSNFGIPNYFGNQMCLVLTDSMYPEIKPGETVFVKKVNPATIEVGDDVMFFDTNTQKVTTHRVREITIPQEGVNEHYVFVTSGVNKHSNQGSGDVDCTTQFQEFDETKLMGKVVFVSAFIGSVLTFMTSGFGLLILLIIPALYLIITSIIDLVKALKDNDDDDKSNNNSNGPNGELSELSLEDKERLKKELLQELVDANGKGDK